MTAVPSENSTTVRSNDITWLKRDWRLSLVRGGMKALGTVSPRTAAKLMDSMWFTAPRTHPKAAARDVLAEGKALRFEVHGRRVEGWSWGEGPTVLLMHGWGGHAGQLHAFVKPLVARGLRVLAFDAPSHGASEASRRGGQRVTFFEFAEALRVVTREVELAGVIAHSGGCAAIALALREGWRAPAKLLFVSPFALPSESITPFANAIGASESVTREFRSGVERHLGITWPMLDVPNLPTELKTSKLLVVHDVEDREVPYDHGETVAASWPGAQMHTTHGLGHRRVLSDSFVVARAVDFLSATP